MIISDAVLKVAVKRAFEEGWNSTGQGCNAEHHNLSSEALAQIRDDAVAPILDELKKQGLAPSAADESLDVKLVDASGCLRLDCNGHRVHLSREQARDLMLKLAGSLDDGGGVKAKCEGLVDILGAELGIGTVHVTFEPPRSIRCVVLPPEKAEKFAIGLLSLSIEAKGL